MLTSKKIFLSIVLLLGSVFAFAQIKFTATVTPGQISRDEYVEYKLSVENAAALQGISLPSLNDFVVISGPNEETSTTVMNGNMKTSVARTFIIKPKGPGKFTIGAATAIIDGKQYKSNPIAVTVNNTLAGKNANTQSQNNNSLSSLFGIDPFADAPQETAFNDYILHKGENATDKVKKNILIKVVF